ncbi:MAG: ATP-binding protein [Desulfotalea sp.]
MIISIASGKGGTGKTMIATNLIASLKQPVTLLDCDVEEPNAHLFLNLKMGDKEEVNIYVPKIDNDLCDGCKKCSDICAFNALAVIGSTVVCFPELCHSCQGCELVCPQGAISPGKRNLGHMEKAKSENITFFKGTLRVGEAMAPPLIKAVRNKTKDDETVIIDAPPGTSCPVITAMKDTDFVLLVTEPTPFGLNDLKLAVGAVRELNLPHAIAINRADLGDNKVHEYAKQEGIEIIIEIPFDRKIAQIYSNGELLVNAQPEWQEKFQELFGKIENRIKAGAIK